MRECRQQCQRIQKHAAKRDLRNNKQKCSSNKRINLGLSFAVARLIFIVLFGNIFIIIFTFSRELLIIVVLICFSKNRISLNEWLIDKRGLAPYN